MFIILTFMYNLTTFNIFYQLFLINNVIVIFYHIFMPLPNHIISTELCYWKFTEFYFVRNLCVTWVQKIPICNMCIVNLVYIITEW